jgi:DNA primase
MFPIHDGRGHVIGFGGRVLDSGEPKYLNSPETPVFSKGRELYGLYLARNAIRAAGCVLVVEGYMDVVALGQHGIEYAVATLGTSTTTMHAQKLFRLADLVVFCFDGDAAGRKAAWRALETTLPVLTDGKEARFLFLPNGQDPDDYVRAHGKAMFEDALQKATPLSEYLLSELVAQHPPATAEGRAALVAAARPYIAQIGAPVLRTLLRDQLAELAGLAADQLTVLLGTGNSEGARRAAPRTSRATASAKPAPSLVRSLLRGVLLEPGLARRHALPPTDEMGALAAAWRAVVDHCALAASDPTTASVVQHFAETEHAAVLAEVLASAADQDLSADQVETEVLAAADRYRKLEEQRALAAILTQPLEQLNADQRATLARSLGASNRSGSE